MRGLRILETRRARQLRQDQTSAEERLWWRLRNRQRGGHKFVRQAPIGPYFADFLCRSRWLVVEIDGATHSPDDEVAADARRSNFLATQGYEVVRFHNVEVYENLESVLDTLFAKLQEGSVLSNG